MTPGTRVPHTPGRDRHVQHVGVLIHNLAGLPHPVERGRCLCHGHGYPIDWWFDDSKAGEDRDKAISVCRRCPVRRACLDYARHVRLRTIVWGVWGGVYFSENRQRQEGRKGTADG